MIRKRNNFYPDEDIIDGFSILCFDEIKHLKNFSNVVFSNISKKIVPTLISKNIIDSKKQMEVKLEQKNLLTPTRVTAQRKSKPDMSTLSMSKKKRRLQKQQSSKRLDTDRTNVSYITVNMIDIEKHMSKEADEVVVTLERCNSFERDDQNKDKKAIYVENCSEDADIIDNDMEDDTKNNDLLEGVNNEDNYVDHMNKKVDKEFKDIEDLNGDKISKCLDEHCKDTYQSDKDADEGCKGLDHTNKDIEHNIKSFDEECKDTYQSDKDADEGCKGLDHTNKEIQPRRRDLDDQYMHADQRSIDVDDGYKDVDLISKDIDVVCEYNDTIDKGYDVDKRGNSDNLKEEDVVVKNIDNDISFDERCVSINKDDKKSKSQIKEDCLINSDCMIGDNVTTLNSPVPTMPAKSSYLMLFDGELDDLNSPMRINVGENCVPQSDHNNNQHEKPLSTIPVTEDEDECVIISVGFDPDPKLNNIPIPISIPTQIAQEVPYLKPAPTRTFNLPFLSASLTVIAYPPKSANNKPPPLIPAPAEYFNNFQPDKSCMTKSLPVIGAKYQVRKRSQMTSSILKPPGKCLKLSPTTAPIQSKTSSDVSNCADRFFNKPLFENNYMSPRKMSPFPSSTISRALSRPTFTAPSVSNHPQTNILKAVHYDYKLPKPTEADNSCPKQPQRLTNGSSICFIRKTMCHVHIAQSIHKRYVAEHLIDNNSFNYLLGLAQPRPLRRIPPSLSPYPSFQSLNLNRTISMHHLASPPPLHSTPHQISYPRKSITSISDLPVQIKPLNRMNPFPPRTYQPPFPSSMNVIPRQNVLLLKQ